MNITKKIWFNLTRSDIFVTVRGHTDSTKPMGMNIGGSITIATGKSKIVVRQTSFRSIEVVLISPRYVKMNWEHCND